jgi:Rrf2 family protein
MVFSKSFGYAIRGVLYIAIMQGEKRFVQAEEISQELTVPRHFMSKILKSLVKDRIIASVKGPMGGFTVSENTFHTPLMTIFKKTEGLETFKTCVLCLTECNSEHPCPLHTSIEDIRRRLNFVLVNTTIGHLLKEDKADFIKSISTQLHFNPELEQSYTAEN